MNGHIEVCSRQMVRWVGLWQSLQRTSNKLMEWYRYKGKTNFFEKKRNLGDYQKNGVIELMGKASHSKHWRFLSWVIRVRKKSVKSSNPFKNRSINNNSTGGRRGQKHVCEVKKKRRKKKRIGKIWQDYGRLKRSYCYGFRLLSTRLTWRKERSEGLFWRVSQPLKAWQPGCRNHRFVSLPSTPGYALLSAYSEVIKEPAQNTIRSFPERLHTFTNMSISTLKPNFEAASLIADDVWELSKKSRSFF